MRRTARHILLGAALAGAGAAAAIAVGSSSADVGLPPVPVPTATTVASVPVPPPPALPTTTVSTPAPTPTVSVPTPTVSTPTPTTPAAPVPAPPVSTTTSSSKPSVPTAPAPVSTAATTAAKAVGVVAGSAKSTAAAAAPAGTNGRAGATVASGAAGAGQSAGPAGSRPASGVPGLFVPAWAGTGAATAGTGAAVSMPGSGIVTRGAVHGLPATLLPTPTASDAAPGVATAAPFTRTAAHTARAQRPERTGASGGLPGLNDVNPARAPHWLRPILYAILGLLIAAFAGMLAPSTIRRRVFAALVPRAGSSAAVAAAPALGIRTIFRRFWPYARPYRLRIALMLLLVPIPPAVQTAEVIVFKHLVDGVLTPHDFGAFPPIAAAFVVLALVGGAVAFADDYLSTLIGERFVLDLRTALFRHVQGLSLDFFDKRRLGDVIQRLTGDTAAIEDLMLSGVASSLSYLLRIAFFAGALFYLRWDLAVVSLAAAPFFFVVARRFARLRRAAAREKRRRNGAMSAVAEESLANAQVVQAFNRQDAEIERFRAESLGSFAAQMAATRLRGLYGPLVQLIELAGVLLILGLGTWELSRGWLSLGGLLAFLALLSQLYRPIRSLGRLGNNVAAAAAGAERVVELLDQRPSIEERPSARPLVRARGAIEFRSVGFRYPGAATDAVGDVSFRVGPGEMLALVGPSGAGKSTLAKLVLRFYDPDEGEILLDGTDIRELELRSLREQVSTVFQETLVFDATIAENIAYGRPDATRAQVEEAARAAGLTQFVSRLPDKLDTVVGEKGRSLSGGQRQRVAIARAYLRDTPILLLDEPTTGLDAQTARRVLRPLRRLAAERATILISHDLSLVREATSILALENGHVLEAGTHDELVETEGLYHWLAQLPERRLQAVGA